MPSATDTILIVDDDPNDVALIRHSLQKLGNSNPLRIFNDGNNALEYLAGDRRYADRSLFPLPFIIILDWKLLGRSGLQVLRGIRISPRLAELCVAVLSGSEYASDREAALREGADLFLQKPLGSFDNVVQTMLEFGKECEPPE